MKLMSFVEFEAFIADNEWVNNDDFDPDSHPDHPWFCVDTSAVNQGLDECSTMISKALGIVPKGDVELRHLERNALELRRVTHGPAKKIFCMGSAGKYFQHKNVSFIADNGLQVLENRHCSMRLPTHRV
jgi:hypothetical protein